MSIFGALDFWSIVYYIRSIRIKRTNQSILYSIGEGEGEEYADSSAAALDIRSERFIASPEQWRHFISPANKKAMAVSIRYEAEYPGITAYLVDAHEQYKHYETVSKYLD